MRTWYRAAGSKDGRPVLFIHGNASNSAIWDPIWNRIPKHVYAVAPDLRMYGYSDPEYKINPTKGLSDWAADISVFVEAVFESSAQGLHIVAHSLGALIAMRLLADQTASISRLTLYATPPPGGFTTKGPDVSFVEALKNKDRHFIKNVVNMTFWHPSYRHPEIEKIVDGVLEMQTGTDGYPNAIIEAVSPTRNEGLLEKLLALAKKPPITWVRGEDDVLISNNGGENASIRYLEDVRQFLSQYADLGGSFKEIAYPHCGHSPFLEIPQEMDRLLYDL